MKRSELKEGVLVTFHKFSTFPPGWADEMEKYTSTHGRAKPVKLTRAMIHSLDIQQADCLTYKTWCWPLRAIKLYEPPKPVKPPKPLEPWQNTGLQRFILIATEKPMENIPYQSEIQKVYGKMKKSKSAKTTTG